MAEKHRPCVLSAASTVNLKNLSGFLARAGSAEMELAALGVVSKKKLCLVFATAT